MDDSTVRYIRVGVKATALLGYLPYEWCEKTRTLTFDKSFWKRLYVFFYVLRTWSYLLSTGLRAFYVTYVASSGTTISRRTNIQFVAVGNWAIMPFQLCSLVHYSRLHVMSHEDGVSKLTVN